ncbi:MAG: hypothetical protein HY724_11800 [Candidatus Rokubacteria bacterium]|nr:hypothetical protein [Candidatus Rokubacteria bacterium]
MRTWLRLLLVLVLLGPTTLATFPSPAESQPVPGPCVEGILPSGALSMYCIPSEGWNGDLVVYAHGYVAYNEPIDFYHLTLPDGTYLPDLVQSLGYAFATTSCRQNGLAILECADDIRELVAGFPDVAGTTPLHTYMTGVSEGGLVTALLVEQSPELFSGGLATCGPIGNFRKQINYFGDFRVLFDYFFPGVLPPSPISIPQDAIDHWEDTYEPAVESAVAASPGAALQLINTSNASIDPKDATSVTTTTVNVLWYNVFGTNDATAKLGGNPYDNTTRLYRGSTNDLKLNMNVERFTADQTALDSLMAYETTGVLTIPLVTLHTTGDEVIPFWNEVLYLQKVRTSGTGNLLTQMSVVRYGHCNFTTQEALLAFFRLVFQVTGK